MCIPRNENWHRVGMPTLDVIIPVKDRQLKPCVDSLLALGHAIDHLWICDGGSTQPQVIQTLDRLRPHPKITVLDCALEGFNKATLINHGLYNTQADSVLISDADIVWNLAAIQALTHPIRPTQGICCIEQVVESDTLALAPQRPRYGYTITHTTNGYQIAIQALSSQPSSGQSQRPGCGLICADRSTYLQLGGYKDCFTGWGWEDQDLLIRAALLEIPIQFAGRVIHLSHGDCDRNRFHHQLPPAVTRDRNILTCLQALERGELWGNLPRLNPPNQSAPPIQISLPPTLSPQDCLSDPAP